MNSTYPSRKGKPKLNPSFLMSKEIILGLARHILTTLGGSLVANGTLDSATLEASVGAVLVLAGVTWSIIDKRRTK